MFPVLSFRILSRIGSLDFSMFSLVDFVAFVAHFLSSNKITTKNSELKRNDLENAKKIGSVYSADIRVSFSVSLRIVCGLFLCGFSASLADAIIA